MLRCPNCRCHLETIEYEGILIESCPECGGEWLDHGELRKIIALRETKFDPVVRQVIASAPPVPGVTLEEWDRQLVCPKCGVCASPINYGGDTGIIVNRCGMCHGLWLDADELDKIQMLIEQWEADLPEDLKRFAPLLWEAEERVKQALDVRISRLPLVGRFINSAINGILDLTD